MALRVSATLLDGYRLWRDTDWKPEAELIASIKGEFVATPRMMLGRSGHCALEDRMPDHVSGGYHSCEGFRWSPETIAECRKSFRSGGVPEVKAEHVVKVGGHDVTVVVKCDRMIGTGVVEHKFSLSPFDFERYQSSFQWRIYYWIFKAAWFQYTVYSVKEGDDEILLTECHPFMLDRYTHLRDDCMDLLSEFVHYVDVRGLGSYLQPRVYAEAK